MIVIDASIAVKWLNEEEADRKLVIPLLNAHLEGKEEIVIPSLLFLEVANALVTKPSTTEEQVKTGLQILNDLELKIHSFTKKDLIETATLAKKYHTTVYDMLYAVVAKDNNCMLITADEKFLKKTQFPFVKLLKTL